LATGPIRHRNVHAPADELLFGMGQNQEDLLNIKGCTWRTATPR
jgi:hypothetical protein